MQHGRRVPRRGPLRALAGWARSSAPRRQLVAVGLAAVLLHVVVVTTAVQGLREVEQAHADVGRIVTAQRHFQDADMAHDAIRADALLALIQSEEEEELLPGGAAGSVVLLRREIVGFRDHLGLVDEVPLPAELARAVREVRPLQERFAADAEQMADLVLDDPAAAHRLWGEVEDRQPQLVQEQAEVTRAMSEEVRDLREVASADEKAVQWRVGASAVVALLSLLGLTWLLHHLGGWLSDLVARERDVAETLQHRLLPDRLPDLPGVRLAARYTAGVDGAQVGGDWYDVLALPGGRVGLVMGDVVGHDLNAASDMGQLRNALRACAAEGAEPEEVLERLNRLCVGQGLGDMATVLYAVLDPVLGTVRTASAGHYPPLLVSAAGARYLEAPPCPPIGAVRGVRYTSHEHTLPPGSRLLLYTDGLVERRSSSVDDGLARLRDLVAAAPDRNNEQLCDEVLRGMLAGAAPDDDVALLVVGPDAELGPRLDLVWPAEAARLAVLRQLLQRWLTEAGATDDESYDVVVACSEAVTNAVEHAYGPGPADFHVVCDDDGGEVTIFVRDWGRWREARGQDRGRGLSLMQGLMDSVQVAHGEAGTEVRMVRRLAAASEQCRARPLVVTR